MKNQFWTHYTPECTNTWSMASRSVTKQLINQSFLARHLARVIILLPLSPYWSKTSYYRGRWWIDKGHSSSIGSINIERIFESRAGSPVRCHDRNRDGLETTLAMVASYLAVVWSFHSMQKRDEKMEMMNEWIKPVSVAHVSLTLSL